MPRDDEIERLRRLAGAGDVDARAELERIERRRGSGDEDLLSLVLVDPSQDQWRVLWERAEALDDDAISRLDDLLTAHWPDALRRMPRGAVRALVGGRALRSAQRPARSAVTPDAEPRWRLVRRVESEDGRSHPFDRVALARLHHCRALDAITQLVVHGHQLVYPRFGAHDDALADLHHLRALARLELPRCGIGDASLWTIAQAPDAGRLSHLELRGNHLSDRSLVHLSAAVSLPPLKHLGLFGNAISHEGVSTLATLDLSDLAELDLGENAIGDEGVATLARARLPRLRHLGLSTTRIGSTGVRALAGAPWAGQLRELDLSHNELGVLAINALVDSPCFRSVERLSLAATGLRRGALATLANHDTDGIALRELDLRDNPLSADGLRGLLDAPWMPQLTRLALGDRRLDPFLAELLTSSGRLESLRRLEVPALTAPGGQRLATVLLDTPNLPLAARLGLIESMSVNWLRQLASTGLRIPAVARMTEAQLREAIREALPVAPDDLSATD